MAEAQASRRGSPLERKQGPCLVYLQMRYDLTLATEPGKNVDKFLSGQKFARNEVNFESQNDRRHRSAEITSLLGRNFLDLWWFSGAWRNAPEFHGDLPTGNHPKGLTASLTSLNFATRT